MDLDSFVARHRGEWDRLDVLVRRRRLTGAECDELITGYQRVATQLSTVRASAPDPALVSRLSTLVARARGRATGSHSLVTTDVARFFLVTFPVTVYRARWWVLGAAAGSVLVAVALGAWVATHPEIQSSLAAPADIKALVENDFEDYYSSAPAGSFAARVWTNNAWVAALSIAFGGLLGLPVLWVLWQNASNVGVTGGFMAANDRLDLFFGLILPHGLLELTAVFVAAGVGLRLGWTVVDPGRDRTRAVAFGQEGRAAMSAAIGLVVVLLVSGVIEAFVTPSGLPTAARVGIGVLALVGFVTYVAVLGRRASAAGETGDLGVAEAGAVAPTSG
jgi:uncharacterized membrane protein SpoIIM required for sporulation